MLHIWSADDGNIAGPFAQIIRFLSRVTNLGKPCGYYVQPSKCQLITKQPDSARYDFEGSPLASKVKITNGSQFLGGHIRINTVFYQWLSDKVQDWEHGIAAITTAAASYPSLPTLVYRNHSNKSGNLFNEHAHARKTLSSP
jgi:hypothetical protein